MKHRQLHGLFSVPIILAALSRGSVVGFASIATAASFGPHQKQPVPSSSSSSATTLVHPFEKKNGVPASSSSSSSATCLAASSSSSSFTENKDDDESINSSSRKSSSSNRSKISKQDMSNYHLIWSPGAFKKIAITTFCLLVLPRFIPQSWKGGFLFFPPHQHEPLATAATTLAGAAAASSSTGSMHCHATSATTTFLSFWGRNFVLPLAASSCCLLQLGLNLLSFGCAGWNTVLGPIRPYFLSLLLYTFIIQRPLPRLLTGVWQAFVALLPEMVHLYNKQFTTTSSPHSIVENELLHQVDVELDIPTMGCVACIQSINHALRQQNHVISASSELKPFGAKGGQASIRLGVQSPDDVTAQIQALIQAVERTGFGGATATSVRTSSQKKLLERVNDDDENSCDSSVT